MAKRKNVHVLGNRILIFENPEASEIKAHKKLHCALNYIDEYNPKFLTKKGKGKLRELS